MGRQSVSTKESQFFFYVSFYFFFIISLTGNNMLPAPIIGRQLQSHRHTIHVSVIHCITQNTRVQTSQKYKMIKCNLFWAHICGGGDDFRHLDIYNFITDHNFQMFNNNTTSHNTPLSTLTGSTNYLEYHRYHLLNLN